jgi:putative flippase GtrA
MSAHNVAAFGELLTGGLPYLSGDAAGIVVAFTVNFSLADHFVFADPVRASAN